MHNTLQQLLSGELTGTKRLKLSCGLTEFPSEIFQLADTLEILDLSGNQLTQLPDDFGRLRHLKIFFCSDNHFTVFPEELGQCPDLEMVGFKSNQIAAIPEGVLPARLRWLILTNNRLEKVPKSIGQCLRLQKCMLAGNRLKELPAEMAACVNLELLRISANELQAIPEWLFTMPRLSWLAFAGNPCCVKQHRTEQLTLIDWNELDIKHQLGEGASGFVSTGTWQQAGAGAREIAVKVFKGEVTSDGWPAEEMSACVAAGEHPGLVKILGQIGHHPASKQGLVLHLIPAAFRNLGLPPDFITCTRDTFPESTVFSLQHILSIASAIASVARHLHARGIMHGDLYCHNILVDNAARVLLVDFGAASFYDKAGLAIAAATERLEVRAFGCLLDDLLTYAVIVVVDDPVYEALIALRERCMDDDVMERPDFATIHTQLETVVKDSRFKYS